MPRRTTYLSLPTAFFYSLFHCTSLPFPLSSAVFRRSLSTLFLLFKRVTASRAVSVPPESTRPSYASRNLSRRVRSKVVQTIRPFSQRFPRQRIYFRNIVKKIISRSVQTSFIPIESSARSNRNWNRKDSFAFLDHDQEDERGRIGIIKDKLSR